MTSLPRSWPPPGDWRTSQLDGDKKRRQGSHVCLQLPGEQPGTLCRVLTSPFYTLYFSAPVLRQTHTQVARHQSPIFLREFLLTEDKQTKINSFANKGTVGQPGQNTCT